MGVKTGIKERRRAQRSPERTQLRVKRDGGGIRRICRGKWEGGRLKKKKKNSKSLVDQHELSIARGGSSGSGVLVVTVGYLWSGCSVATDEVSVGIAGYTAATHLMAVEGRA